MTMQSKAAATISTLLLIAPGAVAQSAPQVGDVHIIKNCNSYTGQPGSSCTITSSNLPQIPPNSLVLYDQAIGIPAGLLDSNVVLDAGPGSGNRALGRCTLDPKTAKGLCTFSDGTEQLAGFAARVVVTYLGNGYWAWEGKYSLTAQGSLLAQQ